jgi:uncharacterized protein
VRLTSDACHAGIDAGIVGRVVEIIEQPGGVRIGVKVVPGASRDRVMGELGGLLKVAVSKPPSGGAANENVCTVLAACFGVGKREVTILSGQTNPRKQVVITGIDLARAKAVLSRLGIES